MTQSYLSVFQRIEGLPKWQQVRLQKRSLPIYWWAFLFPGFSLLLCVPEVMLLWYTQSTLELHAHFPFRKSLSSYFESCPLAVVAS